MKYNKDNYQTDTNPDENIIFGRNAVLELFKSGQVPELIYISDAESKGTIQKIIALSKKNKVLIKNADNKKLDFLSQNGNHQGVVAQIPIIEYCDLDHILNIAKEKNEDPFIIIADEIEDPHNLGALIRSAEALGAHGFIIPKRRSASVNATVYKTSAGACAYLPIAKVTNITSTIESLKKHNIWVYGADMNGTPINNSNLTGPIALIIGSEGKGLGDLVKSSCDSIVSISMSGNVNSLNASVAGGIAMYEIVRQRNNK